MLFCDVGVHFLLFRCVQDSVGSGGAEPPRPPVGGYARDGVPPCCSGVGCSCDVALGALLGSVGWSSGVGRSCVGVFGGLLCITVVARPGRWVVVCWRAGSFVVYCSRVGPASGVGCSCVGVLGRLLCTVVSASGAGWSCGGELGRLLCSVLV